MRDVLNWLERGASSRSCRVQLLVAGGLVLGGGLGCCTATPTMMMVPPCPEPTDEMIRELLAGEIPEATADYLGRVENLCAALAE
jgi:hypothetical protein